MTKRKRDRKAGNSEDEELLRQAVSRGDYSVVQALLETGCNVNLKYERGQTLLHIACDQGHLEIVKLLVNALNS